MTKSDAPLFVGIFLIVLLSNYIAHEFNIFRNDPFTGADGDRLEAQILKQKSDLANQAKINAHLAAEIAKLNTFMARTSGEQFERKYSIHDHKDGEIIYRYGK